MKELLYTCLMSLFMYLPAQAQAQYEQEMKEAFQLWENQQTSDAAQLFENIGSKTEDSWLPWYYAAQVKIVNSFEEADTAKKEDQLVQAQELLNKAKATAGEENVEVMILQAMLLTSRLTIDPMKYGMTLAPMIEKIYQKAEALAPNNPRVILTSTEWKMGSASYYGEDPAIYCPGLEKALQLFAAQEASKDFAPSWGEERAKMLLARTCGKNRFQKCHF